MPLIGLWMASRIVGGRGKGQGGLAVLPAAGQGRRRGVGMPRLLSALHPRGASQYVTGPRPEAARVPAVISTLAWAVYDVAEEGFLVSS
jgi:hypothetical protein